MWTGRIGLNFAVPPTQYRSALRRVITRASQPLSDPPPPPCTRLESRPVTAPWNLTSDQRSDSAASRGERRASERTNRASTFAHHHHRRAGGGSTHPHRLRLA